MKCEVRKGSMMAVMTVGLDRMETSGASLEGTMTVQDAGESWIFQLHFDILKRKSMALVDFTRMISYFFSFFISNFHKVLHLTKCDRQGGKASSVSAFIVHCSLFIGRVWARARE